MSWINVFTIDYEIECLPHDENLLLPRILRGDPTEFRLTVEWNFGDVMIRKFVAVGRSSCGSIEAAREAFELMLNGNMRPLQFITMNAPEGMPDYRKCPVKVICNNPKIEKIILQMFSKQEQLLTKLIS